jgi:hypothetical protein
MASVKYRKIDTRIWNDERVRSLSDDGKLGFLFVLTHPGMTAVGAMRGTLTGLAAELGWPARRFEKALAPAIEAGMVEVNAGASFIGLKRFLRYNQPESPNVAKAWASSLELIPECPQKDALVGRCLSHLEPGPFREAFKQGLLEAFGEAFLEAFKEAPPGSFPESGTGAVTGTGTEAGAGVRDSLPLPPLAPLAGSRNGSPSRKRVDAAWGREAPKP